MENEFHSLPHREVFQIIDRMVFGHCEMQLNQL